MEFEVKPGQSRDQIVCQQCFDMVQGLIKIGMEVLTIGLGKQHCHLCGEYGDVVHAVDFRRHLLAALQSRRPIPVIERLPDWNEEVLAYCQIHKEWENTARSMCDSLPATNDPEINGWINFGVCRFTHWIPMPPKPE